MSNDPATASDAAKDERRRLALSTAFSEAPAPEPDDRVDWGAVDREIVKADIANQPDYRPVCHMSRQAVYTADRWTLNYAGHLVRECSTGEPMALSVETGFLDDAHKEEFCREVGAKPTDFDRVESAADFFAFAFDQRAAIRPACECHSRLRREFLEKGLGGLPEVAELRASTTNDVFGSTLAAEMLFDRYDTFLAELLKNWRKNPKQAGRRAMSAAVGDMPNSTVCGSILRGAGVGAGDDLPQNLPVTDEEIRATLDLVRRVQRDKTLQKILLLSGRYWSRCLDIQSRLVRHEPADNTEMRFGDDLRKTTSRQLSAITHPVLRLDLMRRLSDRALPNRLPADVRRPIRGPIVVAVDESGSMGARSVRTKNTRFEEAKAVGLALANLARRQGRWFALVSWSCTGAVDSWIAPPTQPDVSNELLSFVSHNFCGGTRLPLNEIVDLVEDACGGGIEPDVIIITDGDLPAADDFEDRFIAWRRKRQVRVIGVCISQPGPLLERISTNYYPVPDLAFQENAIDDMLGR